MAGVPGSPLATAVGGLVGECGVGTHAAVAGMAARSAVTDAAVAAAAATTAVARIPPIVGPAAGIADAAIAAITADAAIGRRHRRAHEGRPADGRGVIAGARLPGAAAIEHRHEERAGSIAD